MTTDKTYKIAQKTSWIRLLKDRMAGSVMFTFTMVSVLLLLLIGLGLVVKSLPILHEKSLWDLLFTSKWKPMRGDFGFLPFHYGNVVGNSNCYYLDFAGIIVYSYFLTENSRLMG